METVRDAGEFGCIERITHDLLYRPEFVILGAGDDGAVYRMPEGTDEVISTDTLVEGIHFTDVTMEAADVGWKLCTANFSDMAAMGAEPCQFVISAALPDALPVAWLTACYDGIREACRTYKVNLLGGDITGSRQGVILTGTVIGAVPRGAFVRRSGAQEGDLLCVTGTLGGSGAGLAALLAGRGDAYPELVRRHRRPVPQIRAGQILREAGMHALDDVTDGLASEANEIALASRADIEIDAAAVPIAEETRRFSAEMGKDPLSYVLTGGEDYELLAAGPAEAVARAKEKLPLTVIGRVTGKGGRVFLVRNGEKTPLPRIGYDHFKG